MTFLRRLLLAFLSINLVFACQPNTIKLTPNKITSCEANFYWNQECKEPQFDFCKIKICLLQNKYKNGITGCFRGSERIEQNYTTCMKTCCPSIMDSNNHYQSVSMCDKSSASNEPSSSSANSTLVVVLIILGLICLIIILGSLYYKCFMKRERQININPVSGNPEEMRLEKSEQQLMGNLKWQNNNLKQQFSSQCIICLEERPTLQLQCRHLFHPNCFRSWLKKKRQCGMCRSTKLQQFKLMCNKCLQKSTKLNYNTLMKKKYDDKEMICSNCIGDK